MGYMPSTQNAQIFCNDNLRARYLNEEPFSI